MDIKTELRFLVVYAKCQQDAEASGDFDAAAYHGQFVRRSMKAINRWADMAEAAIAYMEYQATSVHDPDECDLDRAQQRAKLWDAFMEALAKAKAVGQS